MKFKITQKVKELTNTKKKESSLYTVEKHNTDSYWSDGSREHWTVANLHTDSVFTPSMGRYPWTTPNDYTLQPGDVLINTTEYSKGWMEPVFYCRPDDLEQVKMWLGIVIPQQVVRQSFEAELLREMGE